jgi:hypothetical protein
VSKQEQISETEREAIINRWRASGLSRKEFCQREGLNFHSLQWWIYRGKRRPVRAAKKSVAAPRLLPIRLSQTGLSVELKTKTIEASLGSRIVLHFSEAADSDYMTRLMSGLLRLAESC